MIRHEDGLIRVYLTDFGFEGEVKGGTPFFSSPECFLGSEVELSDVYSLGKTFLYCLMEPQMFRYLVTFPIDYENPKVTDLLFEAYALLPLLYFIKQMVDPDPAGRPRIDEIINRINQNDFDNLTKFQEKLKKALYKARTTATYALEHHMKNVGLGIYFFSLNEFHSLGTSIVLDGCDDIKGSMVSKTIHDQGESYLCWVFAFATSFSNSVRLLVIELHKKGKITKGQKKRCFKRMNDSTFHRRLRMEICLVIPTSMEDGEDQSMRIRAAMIRVRIINPIY